MFAANLLGYPAPTIFSYLTSSRTLLVLTTITSRHHPVQSKAFLLCRKIPAVDFWLQQDTSNLGGALSVVENFLLCSTTLVAHRVCTDYCTSWCVETLSAGAEDLWLILVAASIHFIWRNRNQRRFRSRHFNTYFICCFRCFIAPRVSISVLTTAVLFHGSPETFHEFIWVIATYWISTKTLLCTAHSSSTLARLKHETHLEHRAKLV